MHTICAAKIIAFKIISPCAVCTFNSCFGRHNYWCACSEGASVRISTLAYPDKMFAGTIDKVYHLLNSESKTMNVRIKLKNEEYLLKPGMFTNVSVKCKADGTSMPRIDAHALVFEGGKNYVVVVEPDQRLQVKEVDVYKQLSKECYIRSGLSEGDRVLNNNVLLVYNALNAD